MLWRLFSKFWKIILTIFDDFILDLWSKLAKIAYNKGLYMIFSNMGLFFDFGGLQISPPPTFGRPMGGLKHPQIFRAGSKRALGKVDFTGFVI